MYIHSKKLNNLIKDNRNAKTVEERNRVFYQHLKFIHDLADKADKIDLATRTEGFNKYRMILKQFDTWVLKGSDDKPKDYKTRLKDEHATDIRPNMKTNERVYRGRSNYYTKPKIKLRKSDLKNPDIRQLVHTLYNIKHFDKGNWFAISNEIHDVKNDLHERLASLHGLNQTGRTDNEPTPLGRSLDDRISDDDYLKKHPMVHLLKQGFNKTEIADKMNVNVSTVSRALHSLVK